MAADVSFSYQAPWWLPGGNLQTIWAALRSSRYHGAAPQFRRERWTTPDGDFMDVDWLDEAPTLVASRTALPPEGANFPWGGPAENCVPVELAAVAITFSDFIRSPAWT